jgi:nucleoside-diphosphate-sugar epimerase
LTIKELVGLWALDVPANWANVQKANRLLSWSPQFSLEEGLRRSVAWYRENRCLAMQLTLDSSMKTKNAA